MPLAQHIFQVDQRRAERDEVYLVTRIRRKSPPHGEPAEALLLNISRFGFMVRTDLEVIDGSAVAIELPGIGETKARAVWSMDRNLGGEFQAAIEPSAYFDLLARVARAQQQAAKAEPGFRTIRAGA